MRWLVAVVSTLTGSTAMAEPTAANPWPLAHRNEPCDDRAMATNLAEPWNRFSGSGPMSASRLSILDLGENAAIRFAFLWIVRDVMSGELEACRIITITEPNMALVEAPQRSTYRRRGMLGFDVSLSARFAVPGEAQSADSRIVVSLDTGSWDSRVQLQSIGPPWHESHWQGPGDGN